jgi:threonine/homoserine/homoserine lactone efflux protein
MSIELRTLFFALSCGMTAGFAPGPLLALVISQTLKHNIAEGLKVAMAPAFTDLPIAAFAVLVLSRVSGLNSILGVISLIGAFVVSYMGISNFRVRGISMSDQPAAAPKSILQGMATNFFQPHPHIFWFGVGAPAILEAWKMSHLAAFIFPIAFVFAIVSAKVIVALMVKQSKGHLPEKAYLWILRGLGILMLFFAVFLVRDGLRYFGII